MKWLLTLILALSLTILSVPHASAQGNGIPFRPGEQLSFVVYWSFIPAGEATLEILPYARHQGVDCFHLRATARTLEYIDVIYKVRDVIEAYADTSMTRSLVFTKLQQGKSKRNVVVDFDWQKGEACYSNFGERERRSRSRRAPSTRSPSSTSSVPRTRGGTGAGPAGHGWEANGEKHGQGDPKGED